MVGVDYNVTQFDSNFNYKSNKESKLLFDEDARSSTDRFVRPRRLIIKRSERVIEEKTSTSILDLVLEALHSKFIRLELDFYKKFKKKSRVSIVRIVFKKN